MQGAQNIAYILLLP